MKKSLLALSIAAVAASTAASATTIYDKDGSSLDVYGRVQGVVYSSHQAKYNSYDDTSLQATGRLGFNMRTNLTSGIDAFANMEWDVADKTDSFKARYAYLGVDFGAYGVFKAGRFEDAVKYVLGATDIFDDFGCNGQFGNDDKHDGMFMYSLSNNGFDLNLSFQTAQDEQFADGQYYYEYEQMDINRAFAGSIGYTSDPVLFGPVSIKAGYSYLDGQDDDPDAKVFSDLDYAHTWATSISWGNLNSGLYIAALANERHFTSYDDDKLENFGAEAVVAYTFDNGVSLRTGYNYAKFKETIFDNEAEAQVVPVYINYQINPLFNIWTEARFDVGTDDEIIKSYRILTDKNFEENVYSVGARYTF